MTLLDSTSSQSAWVKAPINLSAQYEWQCCIDFLFPPTTTSTSYLIRYKSDYWRFFFYSVRANPLSRALLLLLFRNEPNKKMFRGIRDRLKWIGWINLDRGRIDKKFLSICFLVLQQENTCKRIQVNIENDANRHI